MTEADEILTPPCIYQTICGDCAGRPEAIRIHLNSGEVIRLANVVDVYVTEEKIILRPAGRAAPAGLPPCWVTARRFMAARAGGGAAYPGVWEARNGKTAWLNSRARTWVKP